MSHSFEDLDGEFNIEDIGAVHFEASYSHSSSSNQISASSAAAVPPIAVKVKPIITTMRKLDGILACAALFLGLHALIASARDVIDLTPDNWELDVGQDFYIFVKFYTPWCGHCKRLAPEWERLAAAFRASVYVHIAQVDCDAHKELCSKFGVSGYPTLKWFPRNSLTPETYTGDREAEKLLEFANQKSGSRAALPAGKPSLVVEVTPDNFTEIVKDKTKHVLLEFYAPWYFSFLPPRFPLSSHSPASFPPPHPPPALQLSSSCTHWLPSSDHHAPSEFPLHCTLFPSMQDYEALAETFQYEPDIVIAKFDADKYKGTVEKYKIKGYPELRWYPKDNKKGEPYKTSRNLQPLIDFVNAKANTLRKKGGLLDDDVGRIKDLDKIAVKYALASKEQRVQLRTQMSNTIDFLDAKKDPYAQIYMKIIDHIDSNERYLADEYARVERMLKTPLSPAKIDQFTVRKHILTAFLEFDEEEVAIS
ncbi:unnamed protein product [Closterium sp. NIES-53]